MEKSVKQKIGKIKLSDLHLWSENPRDPTDSDLSDFEIIKKAIKEDKKRWNLPKLAKEMGEHYDFSEIPTVVFKNKKYVVYDGNRRIAILKYLQNPSLAKKSGIKLFPSREPESLKNLSEIPCNICDEKTALINIERKHTTSGTWRQLERDYFAYKHKGNEKSLFLKFEEATGLIRKNPELNENIMKNDILTRNKLNEIGFSFDKYGDLISVYDEKTANDILNRLVELKINKTISSRGPEKYKIRKPLNESPGLKNKIVEFKEDQARPVNYKRKRGKPLGPRKTKRKSKEKNIIFGGNISLKDGVTNDIYRDITDLYNYYQKSKDKLSNTFPNLIRMALRLLIESAARNQKKSIKDYIKLNFSNAKQNLSQDQKTTLKNHSVTEKNLISLLHTGSHTYSNSSNLEQTIAISLVIGGMLKITHKR